MMLLHRRIPRAATAAAIAAAGAGGLIGHAADEARIEEESRLVRLDLVPEGAMTRIGSYMPWSVTLLAERPADVQGLPEDVEAPMFGVFEFGTLGQNDRRVFVVIDEPLDGPARLFVDGNRNGDFTDDAPAEWETLTEKTRDGRTYTRYRGGAPVRLGDDADLSVRIGFAMLGRDARELIDHEPMLKRFRDYARAGRIEFDGQVFEVMLDDTCVVGDFRGDPGFEREGVELLIDVNRNGVFDVRGESFDTTRPFNIRGTTYEMSEMAPDGSSFRLTESSQTVEEIPPQPDQSAGRQILAFEAETLDGGRIRFPEDYRDRIVLLDLWAMWCGPCVGEIPTLVEARKEYHERGFNIVSISIDAADERARLTEFVREHGMTWTHVHDGGDWDGELVQLYCPGGIPAGYLVDGTTGTILAALGEVRGKKLAQAIERALRDRHR